MNDDKQIDSHWDDTQKRIAELLMECRFESLSNDRQNELNGLLRESENHREFAAQLLLEDETLAELLVTDEMVALASRRHSQPTVKRDAKKSSRNVFRWMVLATAVSLSGVLLTLFMTAQHTPVAVMQDEANAVFMNGLAPRNSEFEEGRYSLTSGLVAIQFRNGVSMTVKAPAEFDIIDEFRVKLHRGQVRAFAPETGKGFTIETPKADFEDLGTEFGVTVDAHSGESEVHVFDGKVDVWNPNAKKAFASLRLGDSARIREGKVIPVNVPPNEAFPTLADVGYYRWQKGSEAVQEDSDLVFYYAFSRDHDDANVLKDEAVHGPTLNGKIVGARWVTGRWADKQALLFDRAGDAVELEIPANLEQFTFATWVNVDRLDHALTPVLNSVGWELGDVHLQISRSRQTFSAGVHPKSEHSDTEVKLPLGRWVHLAAVVDYDAKTATTWIDGKLGVESQLSDGQSPTFGKCQLGSWFSEKGQENREFRGRIDEVALWRRTLNKSEIRRLVKAGSPTAPSTIDD